MKNVSRNTKKFTLRSWYWNHLGLVWIGGTLSACAIVTAAFIYFGMQAQAEWDSFSATHQCTVVGKKNGHYGVGLVGSKMGTVYVSGQTTYRCDDGVEYTR